MRLTFTCLSLSFSLFSLVPLFSSSFSPSRFLTLTLSLLPFAERGESKEGKIQGGEWIAPQLRGDARVSGQGERGDGGMWEERETIVSRSQASLSKRHVARETATRRTRIVEGGVGGVSFRVSRPVEIPKALKILEEREDILKGNIVEGSQEKISIVQGKKMEKIVYFPPKKKKGEWGRKKEKRKGKKEKKDGMERSDRGREREREREARQWKESRVVTTRRGLSEARGKRKRGNGKRKKKKKGTLPTQLTPSQIEDPRNSRTSGATDANH